MLLSFAMQKLLESRGIVHQVTFPKNLFQKRIAEQMNTKLIDFVHAMLLTQRLQKIF